jgi:hypothetical protein
MMEEHGGIGSQRLSTTASERGQVYVGGESSGSMSGDPQTPLASTSQVTCTQNPVERILQEARKLYASRCPWPRFYEAILGPRGLLHQLLTTPEAIAEFVRSPAYKEIQEMLSQLRRRRLRRRGGETIKILTVRVPESFHETIAREAAQAGVSINQLCVAKLLQVIDAKLFGTLATSQAPSPEPQTSGSEPRTILTPQAAETSPPREHEVPA